LSLKSNNFQSCNCCQPKILAQNAGPPQWHLATERQWTQIFAWPWLCHGHLPRLLGYRHLHASLLNSSIMQVNCVGGIGKLTKMTLQESGELETWILALAIQILQGCAMVHPYQLSHEKRLAYFFSDILIKLFNIIKNMI
jgi:hypothetical protein